MQSLSQMCIQLLILWSWGSHDWLRLSSVGIKMDEGLEVTPARLVRPL